MSDRVSWEEVWMGVARCVAQRSDCHRAQYGAVIVTPANRVVATGFNGLPRSSPHRCDVCPRYVMGPEGAPPESCFATHSEANALLFADRREVEGGTMYCTGAMCWGCARLVVNSGLVKVVMTEHGGGHRDLPGVTQWLNDHGIAVSVWPG